MLDADGDVIRHVSLLESLERSAFRGLWDPAAERLASARSDPGSERPFGDLFHTNASTLLDGRLERKLPAFRRGNVLVSLLVPDLVAVVDLDREEVVFSWAVDE